MGTSIPEPVALGRRLESASSALIARLMADPSRYLREAALADVRGEILLPGDRPG